ncbi:MAG: hypothetical protein RL885_08265 [Planctomycetota bacterium]
MSIRCLGATKLQVTEDGSLEIRYPGGTLLQAPPETWATNPDGSRTPLRCIFEIRSEDSYGFSLDASAAQGRPIVVDPEIIWSSFLGGRQYDSAEDVAVSSSGDMIVVGSTQGQGFPSTAGSYDPAYNGGQDAFIASFAPDGRTLRFSTFLGGTSPDGVAAVKILPDGSIAICGVTDSSDFPTTANAHSRAHAGGDASDAFAAVITANGDSLIYSTYLGSSGFDKALATDVIGADRIVVGGRTIGPDFPTTGNAYDSTFNDRTPPRSGDAFVTVFRPVSPQLIFSTYVGGDGGDLLSDVRFLDNDTVVIVGKTVAADYPTTPGAYQRAVLSDDGFISVLDTQSSVMKASTRLGGTDSEFLTAVARASNGDFMVVGHTRSSDFPVTPGAWDTTHNSPNFAGDGFVARLSSDLSALHASTFVGGWVGEEVKDLCLDPSDRPTLCGTSASTDFPITPGALNDAPVLTDAFVVRLTSDLSGLLFSGFIEGAEPFGIVAGQDSGNVTLCGRAAVTFLATDGAFDETFSGFWDAFAMQLTLGPGVELLDNPIGGQSVRLSIYELPARTQGHLAQVLLGCSGTDVWNLPGNQQLRLTPDACTTLSLNLGAALRGTVGADGRVDLAPILIPAGQVGKRILAAALSWDTANGQVTSTTPTVSFVIR